LEALSFGVPLLITTNTGGDDIIQDGVQGYIVPPGDAKAMAQKLQQMADDKELLENMSRAATQVAHEYGSWDLAVKRLANLLKPIIHSKINTP
jgi:alpha-maltose-1-phosphate synthase